MLSQRAVIQKFGCRLDLALDARCCVEQWIRNGYDGDEDEDDDEHGRDTVSRRV